MRNSLETRLMQRYIADIDVASLALNLNYFDKSLGDEYVRLVEALSNLRSGASCGIDCTSVGFEVDFQRTMADVIKFLESFNS